MEEEKKIGKRWIAETAFSSMKKTYEEYFSATRFQHMVKEMILKVSLLDLFSRVT